MNEPQHETRDVLLGLLLPSNSPDCFLRTLAALVGRLSLLRSRGIDALGQCYLVLPAALVARITGRSSIAKGLLIGFALTFVVVPSLCFVPWPTN